jgi:hypothetical protein
MISLPQSTTTGSIMLLQLRHLFEEERRTKEEDPVQTKARAEHTFYHNVTEKNIFGGGPVPPFVEDE